MEWILGLIAFGLFVYFVPYKNLQNIQDLQRDGKEWTNKYGVKVLG
jgi:hypothetical protein